MYQILHYLISIIKSKKDQFVKKKVCINHASHLKQNKKLLIWQKLMLKFLSKKFTPLPKEYILKDKLFEESVKLCFLVTFNIIIKLHFFQKFHLYVSSLSKDINFYFVDFLLYQHNFNTFSDLKLFQIGCLRIVSSFINIGLVPLSI